MACSTDVRTRSKLGAKYYKRRVIIIIETGGRNRKCD